MSPTRLRECLFLLGWSQRSLAKTLGWSDRTGAQWASGAMIIPPNVAEWLEIRAQHAERYPPPVREGKEPKPAPLPSRPPHWTDGLSTRARNAVAVAKCGTPEDARKLGYDYFIREPYVGKRACDEIGAAIGGWV